MNERKDKNKKITDCHKAGLGTFPCSLYSCLSLLCPFPSLSVPLILHGHDWLHLGHFSLRLSPSHWGYVERQRRPNMDRRSQITCFMRNETSFSALHHMKWRLSLMTSVSFNSCIWWGSSLTACFHLALSDTDDLWWPPMSYSDTQVLMKSIISASKETAYG